jgi:hypothetical protein
MRKVVTIALCGLGLIVAGCQKETPARRRIITRTQPSDVGSAKVNTVIQPAPQFIDHALLGSQLGPDGMVAKESDSVAAGQPIYLTMFLRESPKGLQTSAVWMGMDKKPLRTERKEMNGTKVVTFGFNDPKLKPGRYKVVGYWGGNIAAEREFEVVAGGKTKRKKG